MAKEIGTKETRDIRMHPLYKTLMMSLKEHDAFKLEYPELKFKETDHNITKFLTDIYKFDGYMVRRPKIILIIDDQSGTKIFTTPNNTFYNLLCLRRH